MYGIYGDIIDAAERAVAKLDETQELLEYPEVQADKAYYLSVLSKYNALKFLDGKLSSLTSAIEEEREYTHMLSAASSEEERNAIFEEISLLRRDAAKFAAALADALGCKRVEERAYCRFKLREGSSKIGVELYALIKTYLLSRGAEIYAENISRAKSGYVQEISFAVQGTDVIARLSPLSGAHKVSLCKSSSEELCFAVSVSSEFEKISERDLKIDVFHSSGAGGQNVNKVETAVRVTHLPTGITVVCQDERSQLKNKNRALENIQKRVREVGEQAEKKRVEADVKAQYSQKNTPLSFDAVNNTMTDTRLKTFSKTAFPLTDEEFGRYIDGLIAL